MKEILILSGKGGAGKTSLSACFCQLAKSAAFIDCDVDASNLPMLLDPTELERQDFYAGVIPEIDPARCTGCGICEKLCTFEALHCTASGVKLSDGCEGCGVCFDRCPAQAIKLVPRHCGWWMRSATAYGTLFSAELKPGAENSGKLIAELRQQARNYAETSNCEYLLSDGPPGIGCPVISAASGVDYAVIVTEPTVSGIHDMERLLKVLKQFEIPFAMVINKYDLSSSQTAGVEAFCHKHQIPLLGKLPFDKVFPRSLVELKTVLAYPETAAAKEIVKIWNNLVNILNP